MKNLFILFLIPFVCSCKKSTSSIDNITLDHKVIVLYSDEAGNDLLDQSKASAYKKEDLYFGININGKLTPIQTDIL